MEELEMESDIPPLTTESANLELPIDGESLVENFIEKPVENFESTMEITEAPTVYEFSTLFAGKTLLELCNSSWSRSHKAKDDIQPYLRGCKWSPDGTCCLSVVNNDGMHLSELPRDLYDSTPPANRTIDILDSVVHVKEAGLIYDFCWYPGMNSGFPETCWYVSICSQ